MLPPPVIPNFAVAHSPNEAGRWHGLSEHLEAVSHRARAFGEKLGVSQWAALAGLWHDLGKFHPDFQRMLHDVVEGRPKRHVDHSTLGAVHATEVVGKAFLANPVMRQVEFLTLMITATIAGHHAGLPESRDALRARFDEHSHRYRELLEQPIPPGVLRPMRGVPPLPPQIRDAEDPKLAAELLARLVLSAVVDADRLDAEAFANEGRPESQDSAALRRYSPIAVLTAAVDSFIDEKVRSIRIDSMEPVERAVHVYRQEVLEACRRAAPDSPGAFSLDVATGGGKTLASLSFALHHAEIHSKDRVIVVIPFTSIIEQTAAEYRRALGDLQWNLLEHHSAVAEEAEPAWGSPDREALRRRLAAENWDPPIIVTTAVQFFESLYSARPARCRKLHNIANAVVVLDEAQTLPPRLLNPTVWIINELIEHFGTTIVLSTATQPALEAPFPHVRGIRQIVPQVVARPPARVRAEVVGESAIPWPELASSLAEHAQVLSITHQRRDARELTIEVDRVLGDSDTLHLSAAMCAAHRAAVIHRIKSELAVGHTCRVVSTQVVEAGVDLDFPVVYRALAGIDSMVQAAGRANREGRRGVEGGLLRIYRAQTKPPIGLLRIAADVANGLVLTRQSLEGTLDLFAADLARSYFRRFYQGVADKDSGVSNLRREFRFRDVEAKYRFIDDSGFAVVVPYGDSMAAVHALRRAGMPRGILRELQRYTVSLYPSQVRALLRMGALEPLLDTENPEETRTFLLRETHASFYHRRFGLLPEGIDEPPSGAFLV
jgi:CRISPR-associated endonuclease/helicase Cas3